MAPYDGAHVHFQMKARILPELSLVFQFSGLLFSGSFKCDEKKVLYFEQEGSRLFANPGFYTDKALILHCMESFDHSTGKI